MRYRTVRTLPQKWHHYSVKTRRKEISDENTHHSKKPTKNSSYQHLQAILAVILVIVLFDYASTSTVIGVGGFVIAPPWANPQLNPCSATSWQLIHWPGDGVCYPIFSQVCHTQVINQSQKLFQLSVVWNSPNLYDGGLLRRT